MSSFKITKLLAQRAIIEGTDVTGKSDSVVVSTAEWDHIQEHVRQDAEGKALDAAFRKFYQPLSDAVAAIQDAAPAPDPLLTYVYDEGVPGVEARPAKAHTLGHDAVLLRAVESGDPATLDRLRWVSVGGTVSLEIAAADEVDTPTPAIDRYEDQLAAVKEAESVNPGDLF